MKNKIIIALISIVTLYSCSDMLDVHQEFIKDGEKVYAPKMDSLAFHSGKGRIDFVYWFKYAPYVDKIMVKWNNNQDSLLVDVDPGNSPMKDSITINNLAENAYTFVLYSIDQAGNKSLKMNGYSSSYGEKYESTLENRKPIAVSLKDVQEYEVNEAGESVPVGDPQAQYVATLESPLLGYVKSIVTYSNTAGEEVTIEVSKDEQSAVLKEVDLTKPCTMVSCYKPDVYCIDTFSPAEPFVFTPNDILE